MAIRHWYGLCFKESHVLISLPVNGQLCYVRTHQRRGMNRKQLACREKPPVPVVAVKQNLLDPSRATNEGFRHLVSVMDVLQIQKYAVLDVSQNRWRESDRQLPGKRGALWPHGVPGTD